MLSFISNYVIMQEKASRARWKISHSTFVSNDLSVVFFHFFIPLFLPLSGVMAQTKDWQGCFSTAPRIVGSEVILRHRPPFAAFTSKPFALLMQTNAVTENSRRKRESIIQQWWAVSVLANILKLKNCKCSIKSSLLWLASRAFPSVEIFGLSPKISLGVKKKKKKLRNEVMNYLEQFLHQWQGYYSDINHCGVRMSTKFKGCSLKSLNLLRGKLSNGTTEWIRLSSAAAML